MIRSFKELAKAQEPFAGGKGKTLARLYQAGFRVPDGFIILTTAFAGDELTTEAWAQVKERLACMRRDDGDRSFVVRSSALSEDSARASFAGEFETVLDVRMDEDIREAIHTVRRSRHSARVHAYSHAQGLGETEYEIAVIVQRLIEADFSGVLFTVDPIAGNVVQMTGNFVRGLGAKLVAGQTNAQSFTLQRPKGKYSGPPEFRRVARELYRNACALEKELDGPQDIEWAIMAGRPYILQSRPITTLCPYKADTGEWNDSLRGNFLWSATNAGEQTPNVLTPFSCSLLKRIAVNGADVSYMAVEGYPPVGIIGGRRYLNLSVLLSAINPLLGGDTRKALEQLAAWWGNVPGEVEIPLVPISRWRWWARVRPRIAKTARKMKRLRKKIPQFVADNPRWCAGIRLRVRQIGTGAELAALWRDEIEPYFHHAIFLVNAGATDLPNRLEKELRELVGVEDANALVSNLGGLSCQLESLGPLCGLAEVAHGEMCRDAYLDAYGHRGVNEIEYAWPRPMEDPAWLDQQLAEFYRAPVDIDKLFARQQDAYKAAWKRFSARYSRDAESMRMRLEQAALAAQQREAVRSEGMRCRVVIRAFALRAGDITGVGEDVFLMTIDEVLALLLGDDSALRFLPTRKDTYERYRGLPPYPAIIVGRFDPLRWAADPNRRSDVYNANAPTTTHNTDPYSTIKGFPGALGVVEGTVRRLNDFEDGDQFQAGEVLVTSAINIGWTLLMSRAAAIITDVGAPLSHGAIVARELGIPAVVGCGDATMRLKTGDRVRVDGGKGLVEILESS